MSEPSGPGSRVPIPRRQLRFDRRRAARRRGFAVFLGVVVVAIAALGLASTRGDEEAVSTGPSGGTSPATGGTGASGSSGNGTGAIVPGETPIEHVVFVVKENRTFNNYFATYPGAEGATEGGTIKCTQDGCHDGPVVQLTKGPDAYPHDLTHCFRCGLTAINGGKMNGFNRMNGPIPQSEIADLYGADLSNYSYLDRDGVPNYWAYADRFVPADHFFTSMYGPTLPEHLYAVAAQSNFIV
ncbi:MAG TPA: alkaline phosphatase family protein, partial [Actinomycetota bacterium]|nr:alkaline phosphatase family protein [Actinomycetota bacterium]